MNNIKKLFKFLWKNDWTPASLLTKITGGHWIKYDTPYISIFGTETGYYYRETERTSFGKWVDKLPGIAAVIFFLLYYPVFGTIWSILFFVGLNIIKAVFSLFTKKWGDIW
jgi:hypothetical protein